MQRAVVGRGYLEHLTDEDLRVLTLLAGMAPDRAQDLRGQPATVLALFERPELFDEVYRRGTEGLVRTSPFLAFMVAVHKAAEEIAGSPYVAERSAPRGQQVPVFDAARLAEFLADPRHRLFLAELLTSFVRVTSGRYWTRTNRGWRSERYSELDPVRLARFTEQAPPPYRPGLYRRIGDVSLFLSGVFPDYAQMHAFGPFDAARLLRVAGLAADDESGVSAAAPIELLEHLGQRWYRRASELAPVTTTGLAVVTQVAARFRDARRVLNHITDRYFSRIDNPWFGPPSTG